MILLTNARNGSGNGLRSKEAQRLSRHQRRQTYPPRKPRLTTQRASPINGTILPYRALPIPLCTRAAESQERALSDIYGQLAVSEKSLSQQRKNSQDRREDLKLVNSLLGVSCPPEEELVAGRSVRKQGTCEDFVSSNEFRQWRGIDSSQIFWAHAPPGSGKSTLCSLVIDRLLDEGHICAYYFFKHEDQQKKTLSRMLRYLAHQVAARVPAACRALADLARAGVRVQNADTFTIWKRLYLSILSDVEGPEIFWVIDGIDESESSRQLIDLVVATSGFKITLRAVQRAGKKTRVVDMSLPVNENDIRAVVAEEIDYLPCDETFKIETVAEITKRAHSNFLWASLVFKRVANCRRQEQVKKVLLTTPDGMDKLYSRMLDVIAGLDMPEDVVLASIFLSWAMYAKTPLTVEELSEPYITELNSIMDLKHTVNEVCGQFVTVNTHNRVTLVHHSAHEYLRRHTHHPFSLEPQKSHEEMFGKCLIALCDKDLRSKIHTLKVPQFLRYAATSWAFHLEGCSIQSDRVLNGLVRFLNGPFPLSWIQYLSMTGHLSELTGVSRRLTAFAKRQKADANKPPMLHRLSDLSPIETWATDLMKIPPKFGRNLTEDPDLIYRCIPALSPSSSVISQKYASNPATTLSISGISNDDWDDCLARVSVSSGKAVRLASSAMHLAVATDIPRGTITLWDTSMFLECKVFNIRQRIISMVFNDSGSLLACCGISQTKVWNVKDGTLALTTNNPYQERAIEFRFDDSDCLFMVTDIRRVYKLPMGTETSLPCSWVQLSPFTMVETGVPEGVWLGTPTSVAFNSDCSQLAVVYKAFNSGV
ncbi:uncharacterized protein BCR38DRAFT_411531 [Pseudomassariella vexata]|uniref:NACHT domain-containing protein n=1 Tax=Pseudomassariella vexata TaxID=1141098 RepID=A0A1Y2DQY6_9PEZI|nr:uncharacterized protein BCR38DRAFT_411531 [Pseudomassariella vexata]ORY61680.1 hypothetical protein BCR38DRAFT_411531 [Pseudomassariella vexata]